MAEESHLEETLEALEARQRKEKRDMVATVTGLKKQATKGEKRKKKEIIAKCDSMEKDLKERHLREISALTGGDQGNVPTTEEASNEDELQELDPSELLAQLESESSTVPTETQSTVTNIEPKVKRNRKKERQARKNAQIEAIKEAARQEGIDEPDRKQIERQDLDNLCKLRNLEMFEVTPDGHCLFTSLADQLDLRHSKQVSVAELRKLAAERIKANADTFSPFLFDEETLTVRDIESYCEQLETTPIWGGDMEILALAMHFDCPVSIIMSGRPILRINEQGTQPELWLAYCRHLYGLGEHYNSLRTIKNN